MGIRITQNLVLNADSYLPAPQTSYLASLGDALTIAIDKHPDAEVLMQKSACLSLGIVSLHSRA